MTEWIIVRETWNPAAGTHVKYVETVPTALKAVLRAREMLRREPGIVREYRLWYWIHPRAEAFPEIMLSPRGLHITEEIEGTRPPKGKIRFRRWWTEEEEPEEEEDECAAGE